MITRIYNARFWAIGGWFTWGLVAVGVGTAISAGTSLAASDSAQSGIEAAQKRLSSLTYQPIDINQLTDAAHTQAVQNATQSLQLEASLQPNVAAARSGLSGQVASDLKSDGNLPADLRNSVTSSALTNAGGAGLLSGGGAVPLTAAGIGTTSTALRQQYQSNAANLLAANPLPTAGLDPGSVASAIVANNTNSNNFNLSKEGGQASLAQSLGQATAAGYSGVGSAVAGGLSSYAGLSALQGLTASRTPQQTIPAQTFDTTNPTIAVPNVSLAGGGSSGGF